MILLKKRFHKISSPNMPKALSFPPPNIFAHYATVCIQSKHANCMTSSVFLRLSTSLRGRQGCSFTGTQTTWRTWAWVLTAPSWPPALPPKASVFGTSVVQIASCHTSRTSLARIRIWLGAALWNAMEKLSSWLEIHQASLRWFDALL